MAIDVDDATLSRCRIDMVLNPDTATTPAPAAADTSDMTLRLGRVRLRQLDYTMRMLPVIDSLSTHIADATLLEGNIAMREQSISLRSLIGSGLAAAYIAPDSATIAATPVAPESAPSAPWTVTIDSIAFDSRSEERRVGKEC